MTLIKAVLWAIYYQVISVLLALMFQVLLFTFNVTTLTQDIRIHYAVVSLFYLIISFSMAIVYPSYRRSTNSPLMWTLMSALLYGTLFYITQQQPDFQWIALSYFYPWSISIQHQVMDYSFNQQLMPFVWIVLVGVSMYVGQLASRSLHRLRQRQLNRSMREQ